MVSDLIMYRRQDVAHIENSRGITNGFCQALVDMRDGPAMISKEEDTTMTNAADQYGVVKPSPKPRPDTTHSTPSK